MALIPSIRLNNGVTMPMISLGTWQMHPDVAEQAVRTSLSIGYNHIDTALDYKNQAAIGKALAATNRTSVFVTTKVPPRALATTAYDDTTSDLNKDLTELGLAYVDLMLIHFPPMGNVVECGAMQEGWRAMEDFYKQKKARAIGVSNYCESSFACILKTANITPAVNQIQYHVGMGQVCSAHSIVAFRARARPSLPTLVVLKLSVHARMWRVPAGSHQSQDVRRPHGCGDAGVLAAR